MNRLDLLDSTLRDGSQGENISFSVNDKLNIVRLLDGLGIPYIEAGNPASNPKDREFFEKAAGLALQNSRIVAFGSTRKPGLPPEEDSGLQALPCGKGSAHQPGGESADGGGQHPVFIKPWETGVF